MARHRKGRHKIVLCNAIIDLGGGHTYTCGRHTHDRTGKCQVHRPAPPTRGASYPIMPRQIREERAS